jgi:carboxylesterase type B
MIDRRENKLLTGRSEGSEDCLTMNVFRRKQAANCKEVSFSVYIYSRAFNRGSGELFCIQSSRPTDIIS